MESGMGPFDCWIAGYYLLDSLSLDTEMPLLIANNTPRYPYDRECLASDVCIQSLDFSITILTPIRTAKSIKISSLPPPTTFTLASRLICSTRLPFPEPR